MSSLVFGAAGQVGTHLRTLLPSADYWTRAQFDLVNPDDLAQRIIDHAPSLIINLAAYTAVDRAEQDPETAWRVNAQAAAEMARAARQLDAGLIHVSTDYVFDGGEGAPYHEGSPVRPINVYGQSKLAGELAVATIAPRHWILRTSWVFSEHGSNFMKTMLRLADERPTLSVVNDQRGCPTYAGDLAAAIRSLSDDPSIVPVGVHHFPGGPEVSWFEFAVEIFREAGAAGLLRRVPEVLPIPAVDYPTPAARPLRSTLVPSPALQVLGPIADWRRGLKTALANLAESG